MCGSYDHEKLHSYELGTQRRLGILDSEFDNNNKEISKTSTDNGISLGSIALEQFARPGKSALDETMTNMCFIYYNHSKRI